MLSMSKAIICAIALAFTIFFHAPDAMANDAWYYADVDTQSPVIDLSQANSPQFSQLDLREGFYERTTFARTQFTGCTFSEVQFSGCKMYKPSIKQLTVQYPDWYDGVISNGRLRRVDFKNIQLTSCAIDALSYDSAQIVGLRMNNCTGRDWNLNRLNVRYLRAQYADFPYGRWEYCEFDNGQFSRPDFTYCRFENGNFARSTMRYCDLSNVSIESSNIRGLKINGVDIEKLMRNAGR